LKYPRKLDRVASRKKGLSVHYSFRELHSITILEAEEDDLMLTISFGTWKCAEIDVVMDFLQHVESCKSMI